MFRYLPAAASSSVDETRTPDGPPPAQGLALWAVEERASGEVVGGLRADPRPGNRPDIEVAYHLARRWWGQGIATEAASACVAAGLADGLPRVVAYAFAGERRVDPGAREGGPARRRARARLDGAERRVLLDVAERHGRALPVESAASRVAPQRPAGTVELRRAVQAALARGRPSCSRRRSRSGRGGEPTASLVDRRPGDAAGGERRGDSGGVVSRRTSNGPTGSRSCSRRCPWRRAWRRRLRPAACPGPR